MKFVSRLFACAVLGLTLTACGSPLSGGSGGGSRVDPNFHPGAPDTTPPTNTTPTLSPPNLAIKPASFNTLNGTSHGAAISIPSNKLTVNGVSHGAVISITN